MPADYPVWTHGTTPHTNASATATRTRRVSGVPAIRVRGATYRGSLPLDGVFELVSVAPQVVRGEERFEVYCSWFGVKPPTIFPRISVQLGGYDLLSDYTGEVVDDISAPGVGDSQPQHFPQGWNANRVRSVIAYYENQTDDEETAEIEAALSHDARQP